MERLILLLILVLIVQVEASFSTDTANIRSTLLLDASYDPVVRPNDTVYVKAGFNLLTIDSVDIKQQSLTVTGWITLEWTDQRLQWDPENYTSKIEEVHALPSEIWKPEIIIDNSLEDIGVIDDENLQLIVKYNGNVEWEPPGLFTTHCEIDITYYPFDRQKCIIELTSWSHTKEQLELIHRTSEVNIEDFRLNGEWILDQTELDKTDLHDTKSDGTIVTFSQIEFVFVLERRPVFYVINVILPIILASFLSCVVFIVPLQSGEKVAYILTLILAIAVLLTMIADSLPHTSLTASVLGIYLAFTLFISVICALLTVLLLNIFHKDEMLDTTSFIYKFTEFINRKRCMGRSKTKNGNNPNMAGNRIVPSRTLTVVTYETIDVRSGEKSDKIDKCEEKTYTRKEMANILDRFCFWVFVTLTFIGTISFLVALSNGAKKHHI